MGSYQYNYRWDSGAQIFVSCFRSEVVGHWVGRPELIWEQLSLF